MPTLQVIIASTRPGRVGLPVANWFVDQAQAHGGFDVEVADLKEINLPFFDEPSHPRAQKYEHQHTKDWSARIAGSDAFVFVVPEYNFGMPATLKNALDFLAVEWSFKTAGILSYGGVSAGTRSAQATRTAVSTMGMYLVGPAVNIPFVGQLMGDDGTLQANDIMAGAARTMLDELVRVEAVMRNLRRDV